MFPIKLNAVGSFRAGASSMPKVHITLPKHVLRHKGELEELLRVLVEDYRLAELNVERVQFLGIASGYMSEEQVAKLRGSGLVRGVQLDQLRHAL